MTDTSVTSDPPPESALLDDPGPSLEEIFSFSQEQLSELIQNTGGKLRFQMGSPDEVFRFSRAELNVIITQSGGVPLTSDFELDYRLSDPRSPGLAPSNLGVGGQTASVGPADSLADVRAEGDRVRAPPEQSDNDRPGALAVEAIEQTRKAKFRLIVQSVNQQGIIVAQQAEMDKMRVALEAAQTAQLRQVDGSLGGTGREGSRGAGTVRQRVRALSLGGQGVGKTPATLVGGVAAPRAAARDTLGFAPGPAAALRKRVSRSPPRAKAPDTSKDVTRRLDFQTEEISNLRAELALFRNKGIGGAGVTDSRKVEDASGTGPTLPKNSKPKGGGGGGGDDGGSSSSSSGPGGGGPPGRDTPPLRENDPPDPPPIKVGDQDQITQMVRVALQVYSEHGKSGATQSLKIPTHLKAPTVDLSKLPKTDWSAMPKDFLGRLEWIDEYKYDLLTILSQFYPHGEGELYAKRVFARARESWLAQTKHPDFAPDDASSSVSATKTSTSGSRYTDEALRQAKELYSIANTPFAWPESGLDGPDGAALDPTTRISQHFLESQLAPHFWKTYPSNLKHVTKVMLGEGVRPSVPDMLAFLFFNMYRHHRYQFKQLQKQCQDWKPPSVHTLEELTLRLKRYSDIMDFWKLERRTLELMNDLVHPIVNKKMQDLQGDPALRWRTYKATYLRPDEHVGRDWSPMWDYLDTAVGYLQQYPTSSSLRVTAQAHHSDRQNNDGGGPQGNLGSTQGKKKKKDKKEKKEKKTKGKGKRRGHTADVEKEEEKPTVPQASLASSTPTPKPKDYSGTREEAWKLYEKHGGCKHCWKGQHTLEKCFVNKKKEKPMSKPAGYPKQSFWYKDKDNGPKKEAKKKSRFKKRGHQAEAALASQELLEQQIAAYLGKGKGDPKGGKGLGKGGGKDSNCFQCGQPGHYKRECPQNKGAAKGGKPWNSAGAPPGKGAPAAHYGYVDQSQASYQTNIPGAYFTNGAPATQLALPQVPYQENVPQHDSSQGTVTLVPVPSSHGYTAQASAQSQSPAQQQYVLQHIPAPSTQSYSADADRTRDSYGTGLSTTQLFRDPTLFLNPG